MDSLEFLDIPNAAKATIRLQRSLSYISKDNVDSVTQFVIQFVAENPDTSLAEIASEIRAIPGIRPFSFPYVAKLIKNLVELPTLSNQFIDEVFEEKEVFLPHEIKLLYECYLLQLIDDQKLISIHQKLTTREVLFAFYFAPYCQYFKDYLDHHQDTIEIDLKPFIQKLDELEKDNYKILKEYLKYGWKKGSYEYALKYDDVEKFSTICAKQNIQPNSNIFSPFETFIEKKTSLINSAALFGSVRVFKNLLLSGAYVLSTITPFAIAGGNYEIVHICEQHHLNFEQSANAAIEYHRNMLLNWLIVSQGVKLVGQYTSIIRNNVLAVVFFMAHGFDIHFNENQWSSALHVAARSGALAVADFLVKMGCTLNARDEKGRTPYDVASTPNMRSLLLALASP